MVWGTARIQALKSAGDIAGAVPKAAGVSDRVIGLATSCSLRSSARLLRSSELTDVTTARTTYSELLTNSGNCGRMTDVARAEFEIKTNPAMRHPPIRVASSRNRIADGFIQVAGQPQRPDVRHYEVESS